MLNVNKTLLVLCSFALLVACSKQQATTTATPSIEPIKHVAVTSIVEHPALDAIRDGLKEELIKSGYTPDKNLKWQYQNAQGNSATAAQIARKYIGDNPDVIVAISTTSAQAVVANGKTIPLVFSGVTNPVEAQLVPNWGKSNSNVTGISNKLDPNKQLELIKRIVPTAKTIGIIYNPGEDNSVSAINELEKILPAYNLKLIKVAAPRSVDVGSAASSIVNKVDVIYAHNDNNLVSAFESLAKVCNENKIPLIAADVDSVPRGAIAALGIDFKDMGAQTAKMVIKILNGEKPGDIAIETSNNLLLNISPSNAKKQGIVLTNELINSASKIVD